MSQHFAVPQALRHYIQFVVWKLVQRPGESKPTKVPIGSVTDPSTWLDYDTAVTLAQSDDSLSGIGFVFTENDPFVFFDIDGCRNPDGSWNADAQAAHAALPGAVWETSQSGHGLHAVMRADALQLSNKRNRFVLPSGTKAEFYTTQRYMALGACDWVGEPEHDCTSALVAYLPERDGASPGATIHTALSAGPRAGYSGPLEDDKLIERMLGAKGSAGAAFGNRATVRQLWEADAEVLGGFYPDEASRAFDHSAADAALMDHLAFWTGCDEERMERLFGRSALGARDKWKERPDYRVRTVQNATRDPQRRYMGSDKAESATQAAALTAPVPKSGDTSEPVTETIQPDKNDHRYMIQMIIECGYDVKWCEFRQCVTVDGEKIDKRKEIDMWFAANVAGFVNFTKEKFCDAILYLAGKRAYHPVRDYLATAQTGWDGTSRLDTWLYDYAGAPDTPYVRGVAAKTLIAAVRRIREPGCKHDEMVVLEGPQGGGKSSLFEALVPDPSWFTDAVTLSMDIKEIMEVTAGKWIVEAPELSKLSGAEVEHVKALLSRNTDTARLAYAKYSTDQPRQFLFFGSTNASQYLLDQTGNRRFWPVQTGTLRPDALREGLQQLWGEAAHREAAGESNRLPQELWDAAGREQAARMYDNPYSATLAERIGDKTGSITMSNVQDIFDLKTRERRASVRDLTAAMEAMGWQYSREHGAFIKGNPERRLTVLSGAVMEPATRLTAL